MQTKFKKSEYDSYNKMSFRKCLHYFTNFKYMYMFGN